MLDWLIDILGSLTLALIVAVIVTAATDRYYVQKHQANGIAAGTFLALEFVAVFSVTLIAIGMVT